MPTLSDPRWKQWARPLLNWLGSGRSWDEIAQWTRAKGETHAFARNVIGYLEAEGEAYAGKHRGEWYWASSAAPPRVVSVDLTGASCVQGAALIPEFEGHRMTRAARLIAGFVKREQKCSVCGRKFEGYGEEHCSDRCEKAEAKAPKGDLSWVLEPFPEFA